MQELDLLNSKLDKLLQRYTAMQAENKRLKETVSAQVRNMEGLNDKLALLEQNMAASKIGTSILKDEEKDTVRKQLDTVIGEIDKILATLND